GWIFFKAPNGYRFRRIFQQVPDLARRPALVFLERNFFLINAIVSVLGLIFLDFDQWLWAFPLRIVLVWHITWSINSFAHKASKAHKNEHSPVNSGVIALISFGEGWHENHHRYPWEPNFGGPEHRFDLGFTLVMF